MADRLYRKRPGGTWYGWYYDLSARRRTLCTRQRDRRAALAVLRRAERLAVGAADRADAAPYSVAQAAQDLVARGLLGLAVATRGYYVAHLRHVVRLLGSFDVNALEIDRTHRYVATRLDEGAHPRTIAKELSGLRRALTLAHERGLLLTPASALLPRFRARYEPRTRFLASEELASLLSVLPARRRPWVLLAVYAGCRRSEIERLRWQDVSVRDGWIRIPGTKTEGSTALLPLAEPLRLALGAPGPAEAPVVVPWAHAWRDLRAACARAGIPPASANDLRRTFASWLVQAGVSAFVAARLLRHRSTRMLEQVYGRLDAATFRSAIERLPAVAMR